MADGDSTVATSVTMDGDGNVILPFDSVQQGGADNLVFTKGAAGFVIPLMQIIGTIPLLTAVSSTVTISAAYARSLQLI